MNQFIQTDTTNAPTKNTAFAALVEDVFKKYSADTSDDIQTSLTDLLLKLTEKDPAFIDAHSELYAPLIAEIDKKLKEQS